MLSYLVCKVWGHRWSMPNSHNEVYCRRCLRLRRLG